MNDSDSDNDSFVSASSLNDSFVSLPSVSLEDTLRFQFSDVPRNFNVIHINAQSIPAHFPDMLANFHSNLIHAILVSETFLKPCLPTTSYSLPGFQLVRNDREFAGCGGVAIYLRSHIPYNIISMSPQTSPNSSEHLFIELELNHTKILLGVFYAPSLRVNYFSSLEQMLETLLPSYSHAILMGDFNTCLLKNDSRSSSLRHITESCNLSILPLNATHHFPDCVPSLLDLIIVSSSNHVAKHGQCSADNFSYHDLIYLSYKIRPPKAKPKIIMQRNFSGIDVDRLREDASGIDWEPLFTSNSIDTKVQILTSNITQLYDAHAPIRAIKVRHLPSPWLTDDIKKLMTKKAAAKSRYKFRSTQENLDKYVAIRNRCNKVCRNAQRQHIHTSIENGDPAKVWKFLNSLGVGKSRQDSIPKNLDVNSLNVHFCSSTHLDGTTKSNTLQYLSTVPTPKYPSFVFEQLTACDVKKSIMAISSNAVGNDCISRNMIIPIMDEILPILCNIFNHSVSSGVFPSTWKEAQIIPLPKKSKPCSLSDYRPISILPFLSKVLERLIHSQLSTFLNKNSLLNSFQSGFRPGHSTATALVNITDDIRLAMDGGNLTLLSLLDFSSAFNSVDFHILLGILSSINISPTAIDWFRSYLFGRRQRIRIEESYSSWCSTEAGVPQGGVLSPLLFAIFINSISDKLVSSYHLYADDLQIYTQAPLNRLTEAFCTINTDLERICEWSKNYGLMINPTKTQVIVIGSPSMVSRMNLSQLPQVKFDGTVLPIQDSVKNLGIYFDKTFSWSIQIKETSRKLFASAGSLRKLKNFLPTATKIALAQSLLLPVLDYADVSYPDLTEEQLDKLERLQNFCIRFIFSLRKYDHVSEFRNRLKWLPIRLRRNSHILALLYNAMFNPKIPTYLRERFRYLKDTHNRVLRSSENLELEMPVHSTNYAGKSFTVSAIRLWNALPLNIRQAKSLSIFKSMLKNHYLGIIQPS